MAHDRPGSHHERSHGHHPDHRGQAGTYVRSRVYGSPAAAHGRRRDTTGREEGNERLTAMTGAALLLLFAAEGVTILRLHQLLTLHFFLGMLLIGPVALKVGATGYRFARYYTGAPGYRRKGPPVPLLRLLGPFVVLTSVAVIGTGVVLGFAGPGGPWLFLHKASFVLWFAVMTIHVIAYAPRLPRLLAGDWGTSLRAGSERLLAGRAARWSLLTASVLAGLLLAVLTYHQAGHWVRAH